LVEARLKKERLEGSAALITDAISAVEDLLPFSHHDLESSVCVGFIDHLCVRLDQIEEELAGLKVC
jgi:hypothetical protein